MHIPFVKYRVSVHTRKRGSKRAMSAAALIASLTWHDLEPNMLDVQFLVSMANLILCFKLNFAIFCGCIWVKNRLCAFKICSPERSDYSNYNQNKYSNSINGIFFGNRATGISFHLICFQNNMTTHDLARRLFTLKGFQNCQFQNTSQLACFPSLLSTCRSRLLFSSLRERRNFGVDRRITINLLLSLVPPACNVILHCMHI